MYGVDFSQGNLYI